MRAWMVAIALMCCAGPAWAQSVDGSGALALAAIVGGMSPLASAGDKTVLAALFNGDRASVASAGKIGIDSDMIRCRAGNIDFTAFACDLTFGAQTAHLSGRSAHELYATLAEVGVAPDGAAGTIYRALYKLHCTIDPHEVAGATGIGADCAYALTP
jgi:hypothetical protein